MGDWPQLVYLHLCDNMLDDLALKYLAQGQWELGDLWLSCNSVSAVGIEYLTEAAWPNMCTLYLDISAISAKTWSVLGLDANHFKTASGKAWGGGQVPRSQKQLASCVWTVLDDVIFPNT